MQTRCRSTRPTIEDARNKAMHFVGGWALHLWGHVYEGRKPALLDNRLQIFVAPIFLAAEVFFALGYRSRLREEVQRRALEMRARAGSQVPAGDLKSA